MTNDILDLFDKRRTLKSAKKGKPELNYKYREINIKIRKLIIRTKYNWIQTQYKLIDEDMKYGRFSKRAYETLRTLTKTAHRQSSIIEDKQGKPLAEEQAIVNRWTEYCQELYNHPINPDINVLQRNSIDQDDDLPILKDEVINAIKSLNDGKSPRNDNISSELLKHGGNAIVNVFTELCQKSWSMKKWPEQWTTSLVIPIPKKGNLRKCENYRTLSLISHSRKMLLRIILNRLNPQVERILSDEQAGFRKGRSTVEQIFNCRILMERHIESQKDLYHNFIDFKKAYDRIWHDRLWSSLQKYDISSNIISMIKSLYCNSTSAVLINNIQGNTFKTTVGIRQGCLLSPVLFNVFLEEIMDDIQNNHTSSISNGGLTISNLRFADDIDVIAGNTQELQALTDKLSNNASKYGMEISIENSKVMINSNENQHADIYIYGCKLEEVEKFKYLGATLTKNGTCDQEVRIRLAQATSAMVRLTTIWKSTHIIFKLKYNLYRSLILSILTYGCESWTLNANITKKILAFENKSHRKLLCITYKKGKTNLFVKNKINILIGTFEPLLQTIRRRRLKWFGHTSRHNSITKTILQGMVEGSRKRGRPKRKYIDDVKELTKMEIDDILLEVDNCEKWRRRCFVASKVLIPPTISESRD